MTLIFATSIKKLNEVTENIYVHPFLVSNAALEIKSNIFQMRSELVSIVLLSHNTTSGSLIQQQDDELETRIFSDLELINANFLGDKSQVIMLKAALSDWFNARSKVISALKNDDIAEAERLLQTESTQKYYQVIPLVNYVSNFARIRARQFVEQSVEQTAQFSTQLYSSALGIIFVILVSSGMVLWRVSYLEKILAKQANRDSLTGVANRRHFLSAAEYELSRGYRYKNNLALAIVDIDFFKKINDEYGHLIGDEALKVFCSVCKESLRATDILARIGGEEFAVMLPSSTLSEAKEVLERVRLAVENHAIELPNKNPLKFTASFGVTATSFVEELISVDGLIRKADAALYESKNSGRNCITAFI
jgi:diguanylate cyclase (GGDEF)-like protein